MQTKQAKPLQFTAKDVEIAMELLRRLLALIVVVSGFVPFCEHMLKLATELLEFFERAVTKKDSSNSSLPGSKDIGRRRSAKLDAQDKKLLKGGQPGHEGATLKQTDKPTNVVRLTPGWEDLENNTGYRKVNTIRRQVFDLEFKTVVTEYCVDVFTW
jgi:hypothetical protein